MIPFASISFSKQTMILPMLRRGHSVPGDRVRTEHGRWPPRELQPNPREKSAYRTTNKADINKTNNLVSHSK